MPRTPTRTRPASRNPQSTDWRSTTLEHLRSVIRGTDTRIVEERKWKKPSNPAGVPVWSCDGIICTGETYKDVVKLTFMKGASLPDPSGLFNASLEGNARRAIDVRQGETLNARALRALVKAAIAANGKGTATGTRPTTKVRLLAGGNPQIAMGDGDAPVQAYIAAMPGWRRDIGARLDALISRTVPNVRKAVKWNSPFYGMEGRGWFMSFHTFTRYVKVTFFAGTSLRAAPTGGTSKSGARWIDIHEDEYDEAQLARWIAQASKLPGWLSGKPA